MIVNLYSLQALIARAALLYQPPLHRSTRHFACVFPINNTACSTFDMIFLGCIVKLALKTFFMKKVHAVALTEFDNWNHVIFVPLTFLFFDYLLLELFRLIHG